MNNIQIKNLKLSYQNQILFDNFNFTLPANKWTSLLGVSGIGKTTLLRIIAGLIDPKQQLFSGQINNNKQHNIAYVTQQDSLLPWLKVIDNVLLGYKLRNKNLTPQIKASALILLQKAGLERAINLLPHQLSSGMRQRVQLVRTLVDDQTVILLDEPFSALDLVTKFKLQNLATELLQNRTVLLVTHDPQEALRLSNNVYVLHGIPAKLSEPIELHTKIPRDPANPELLAKEAALIKLLMQET